MATADGFATLTSVAPTAEVTIKTSYSTITKTQSADEEAGVEIGEVINYTITGQVPTASTGYIYTIEDTMTTGLTYNKDIEVKVDGTTLTGGTYTVGEADNKLTITISVDKLQNQVGKNIEITYSATVKDAAAPAVSTNSAVLIYGDNSNPTKSAPVETKVFSTQIVINKTDGTGTKPLAGAKFVLTNEAGAYYDFDETSEKVT